MSARIFGGGTSGESDAAVADKLDSDEDTLAAALGIGCGEEPFTASIATGISKTNINAKQGFLSMYLLELLAVRISSQMTKWER